MAARPQVGWFVALIAWIGARIIYGLIRLCGRTHRRADIAWLIGPVGGKVIGESAYREAADAEGLTIERDVRDGGLLPRFDELAGNGFEPGQAQPLVREFYEHTSDFTMDIWSRSYFPSNIGLWLLVKTVSRQVNQLNFPLSPLDTARGVESEIISLRRPDGTLRYTGWLRTFAHQPLVLYTGFYMVGTAPNLRVPCVKVVFPMPGGNATVMLRPRLRSDGSLLLDSAGERFGDAGFYRVQNRDAERVRVWRIRTLKERFHVYVDPEGVLRCDHAVRFVGLPVLTLHYKIVRRPALEGPEIEAASRIGSD